MIKRAIIDVENVSKGKEFIEFDIRAKNNLQKRSDQIELLVKYTEFLQKECYIDTDATCEEPYAVDEFMKTLK